MGGAGEHGSCADTSIVQGFWGLREGGHGQAKAEEEGVKEGEAGEVRWSRLGCAKQLPCHVGKKLQNLPMESQELLLGSGGGMPGTGG